MKKNLLTLLLAVAVVATASAEWKIAGDKIRTTWAENLDPNNVLAEYPRPQLERNEWMNLNGLWSYAVTDLTAAKPTTFDGQILVPFAIESALSGVQKRVTKDDILWYERTFTLPSSWNGKRVMLNFGAVDWSCDVYLNDILVGNHTGGYAPFSLDITAALTKGEQRLVVRVWDPTDSVHNPVGKQRLNPSGIWYTAVSGIWQTVWLEPVAKTNHIEGITTDCDIVRGELYVDAATANSNGTLQIEVLDGDKSLYTTKVLPGVRATLPIKDAKLWTPDTPHLYTLKFSLIEKGKVVDSANSYAALRQFSVERDAMGHKRMTLNGAPIFMYGPLDQGWWPDGLYTAPSDEALLSDVILTKELGFNTIRKHIKVEPARWYYHCDQQGIIVWQDMPCLALYNGNSKGGMWGRNNIGGGSDSPATREEKECYYKEWAEIMDALRFFPSIGVWVPFNEAWGQFDTETVAEWTAANDPTRLINAASGGNLRLCGDILDIHNYPAPSMPFHSSEYVVVLGEYGGIGYPIKEHLWWNKRNWGYIQFNNTDEVTDEYVKYATMLKKFIPQGMAAAIYTQTTDVEGEVNGFVTYDRKVVKMDKAKVKAINTEIINLLK
ncbi:MAG: beta-galactosidase [Alistipes sp.]|nr:beta-galactosidase [Alistipes sp.]